MSANSVLPPSVVTMRDRKSTRLNSSHVEISYAVFCLKKKKIRLEASQTGTRQRRKVKKKIDPHRPQHLRHREVQSRRRGRHVGRAAAAGGRVLLIRQRPTSSLLPCTPLCR